MAITVHCYEPHAKPLRATAEVEKGGRIAVYVMSDGIGDDARGLRQTILRESKENPPSGVQLVLELEPRAGRPGQPPTFLTKRVGRRMAIEVIRPDSSRGRVTKGT